VRSDLPTGTVTFLFTDVEGSTRLLHELGPEAYADGLAEHRRIVRQVCSAENGVEVDTQGDAFFFAFPTASGAVTAALAMTDALADGVIRLRIGLHTGTPLVTDEGYVGDDVHFAARVGASAHGGQVVLSQATRALVDGLSFTDLGEHRLKDIDVAVPIYQLGDESFPPLKTISNTNLPHPASSFVGRERELSEVLAAFEQGTRLLTLTGPGGSGKTRLAVEAAATLVPSYKAGVFWVGLASVREPSLVTETIAQTLGARDGLAEHIADREMLLLLDNLEQVVEAAPALSGLVRACPNLTLFCTSRELLRVQGEVEYSVPPLASPEAVALFCERSQLDPADDITELCARLDDLPLAVELAAARTKALSPTQILERLSDRFDLLRGGRDAEARQQTLRATIAWSYDLLSDEEQRVFRALSVFVGGCTLEAAEAVAHASIDTLQSLVEKSLLRFTDERYWMLETIREYAVERLEESGEEGELRPRQAEWFVALAAEAEPHLTGSPKAWLDRLEVENANIRTALDHLEASGSGEHMQRLCGAIWRFWAIRGYIAEGRRRVEAALEADSRATIARARALNGATVMALVTGEAMAARRYAEEAIDVHRVVDDPWGESISLGLLGNVHADERDFEGAERLFEAALKRHLELGDDHRVLVAMDNVAGMRLERGDISSARSLHEEIIRRAKAAGNLRMEASSLSALGEYALREERVAEALPLLEESCRISRDLEDNEALLDVLYRLAWALAVAERAADAARVYSATDVMRHESGRAGIAWLERENEQTLERIHARLDEDAFARAWEEGERMAPDEAIELALSAVDDSATPGEQAPPR
jgi:predicted ATPase/class 3 adenylate cyclase